MNAAHSSPGEVLFALPVEGLDNQRLHEFAVLCSPSAPSLIVTQQRARAIGIEASAPMTLPLSDRRPILPSRFRFGFIRHA